MSLSEEQPSDLYSLTLTKGSPQQWAGTKPTHEQKQVLPPQTQGGSLPAGHQTPGPACPESLGTLTSPIPSAPVHKQLDACPLAVPEVIATPLDGACASGGMASPTQGSTGSEGDLPEMKKQQQQQPHLTASQDGNLPSKGAGPDPAAHKGRPPREDGAAQEPKQKGEGSPAPGAPQASGSLGEKQSEPRTAKTGEKSRKQEEVKPDTQKSAEMGSASSSEPVVTIYFHAILSKDFNFDPNHHRVVIRGGKEFGKLAWKGEVCEMHCSR